MDVWCCWPIGGTIRGGLVFNGAKFILAVASHSFRSGRQTNTNRFLTGGHCAAFVNNLIRKMPATSEIHITSKDRDQETEVSPAAAKKSFCGFHDERGYLDQIEYIIQHGHKKGDRTGTGVISVFGTQARYSLRG